MKTLLLPERFDHQTAPAFCESVLTLLEQDASGVRIEINDACSMDSAGVATLLHCQRRARQKQLPLQLSHIPQGMQALLTLYGLDGVFDNQPEP